MSELHMLKYNASRRDFLKTLGALAALPALGACRTTSALSNAQSNTQSNAQSNG